MVIPVSFRLQLSHVCITKAKQLWFLFLIYLYMFFTFLETGFNSQVKLTCWWTLRLSVNPFLENFALAMGWIRIQFLRHCISFLGTCLFTSSKKKKNWSRLCNIHTYICICMYVCIYVYMYICIYVYMYICIYSVTI